MDENQIQEQIDRVVEDSPVTTASRAKRKITYERKPMDVGISELVAKGVARPSNTLQPKENPDAGTLVNTTRKEPGAEATQHTNGEYSDAAKLASSGGEAYIGGSVRPNSSVRASLRPMDRYAGDPFWLESTDRFTPVQPWTVKMAILNEPAKLDTFDVDKAAYYLAKNYQAVPDEDFFGYEYVPLNDLKETWWSAFWSDYMRAAGNTMANAQSSIVGLWSKEEAAKTPEQRAEENRNANGYFFNFVRRKGQQYLDYLNQLEPLPRGRGAEILGGTGGALYSATPAIASIPYGAAGWAAGAAGTTVLSAVETQETRDKILESGGSVGEAQKGQWKHLGAIGATELASGLIGQGVTQHLIRGAINRGASRALTQTVGAVSELGVAAPIDATTEVYQDKLGNIIAGRAGYESLYGWSREDWNTFYSTLLLGAFQATGGAVEGAKEYNKTAKVSDEYLALVAKLKQGLVEKAASNGFVVSQETLSKIDDLAMKIYEDPEGIIDSDMRAVAQGFYDKLQNLPPEVVEQARKLNTEQLQGLSEKAFQDLDNRVRNTPGWDLLSPEEQTVALSEVRAGAYVGALWFGQSPADFKVPIITDFVRKTENGWYGSPDALQSTIYNLDVAVAEEATNIISQTVDVQYENRAGTEGDLVLAIRDELNDIVTKETGLSRPQNFAKNTKIRRQARLLLEEQNLDNYRNKVKKYAEYKKIQQQQGEGGALGLRTEITDPTSPYDLVAEKKYFRTEGYSPLDRLEYVLHEFSHLNDWNITDKGVTDLTNFIKWYTSAISEVFGSNRGINVGETIQQRNRESLGKDVLGYNFTTAYTTPQNITENRAQAVGRLLQDAKDYIGLNGLPAQYIQAANAILTGFDETMPLPDGLSDYVSELKNYVKQNSKVINRIRDKVPAQRMRAAIQSYMGGNDNINWQGVDPMTLAEFAEAIQYPLDSDALQYALDSLGNINTDDFVNKAQRDWDEAWDKFYADNPDALKARAKEKAEESAVKEPTETDVIVGERETEVDGGIDPEKAESIGIEDWDEDSSLQLSKTIDPMDLLIEEATKKGPSEFRRKINRKFDGKTLPQSMDDFKNALEQYDHKSTVLNKLDFVRGVPAFLIALGGQKLANQFDLVNRYDTYSNKVLEANEKLVQRLLSLFNGDRNKYEDYIRKAGVRKYELDYRDPYSNEKRLFSKRDLMSGVLYNEQPDSKDRIAKVVNDEEVRKHLDDFDIKFAHALRDYLKDEYRKVKDDKEGVPVNYWPIIDQRTLERGDERIINDMGRKETDAPIGLLDVLLVIGSYQSRVAGTQSGYFAALRRLNSIVDYDAKAAMAQRMDNEDLKLSDELEEKSSAIRRIIKSRLSEYDYERFVDNIKDTITHRNDDALKDSLVSKIARNAITTLLGGKIKQFFVNLSANVKWLGYEHNTYGSFMYGLFDAMLHPAESLKLAKQNETLINRAKYYKYNEYMEKNLSANSDNLMTYVANWATKNDWRKLESLSDFLIHVGTWTKRVLGSFTIGGDYLANVFGYAASYNAAKKALGSDEAAKKSLSDFINTRQSTTNQAVKGLMVRRANRQGVFGHVFAFTGEPTQTFGTIAQDVDRMITGDLAISKGSREVTAEVLSIIAYAAVQSGWFVAMIAAATGGADLNDDDWDRIYDNVFTEMLAQMAGVAGPLSNVVAQPMLNLMFLGRDHNGLSIPALAETYKITKDAKSGNAVSAITRLGSLAGVAIGLTNAMSGVEGTFDLFTKSGKKKKKGLYQAFGFSEAMAKRLSGAK